MQALQEARPTVQAGAVVEVVEDVEVVEATVPPTKHARLKLPTPLGLVLAGQEATQAP